MIRTVIQKKIAWTTLTGFSLLSVFSIFCFGMPSMMGMDTSLPMGKVHASILSCMDTQNNACVMNIANHIDQWESALLGVFQSPVTSLFTLLAVLLTAGIIRLQRTQQEALWRHRLRLHRWRSVLLKLFDSIIQAFSQGILHSQIYA